MKITKLLSVVQSPCELNTQPEWTVTFEVDGQPFQLTRVTQWNQPELHQIQSRAEQNPAWFWEFSAKPVEK